MLLIAVVGLCTVENDVIHAAYLAIALLLFRRRDALRAERQSLFKWLPLYNFTVMLVTLVYQAPFNSSWDRSLQPYLVREWSKHTHTLSNWQGNGLSSKLAHGQRVFGGPLTQMHDGHQQRNMITAQH